MGMTIAEKIMAKYSGNETVSPGEYIVLKNFIGPIGYSFTGMNMPKVMGGMLDRMGLSFAKPENIIVNGDHNTPPSSIADVEMFKAVREAAEHYGIEKVYDSEGIGHVVNVEKGEILPGTLFVHMDPQGTNAGGVGALYTNGGRFGSSITEAFVLGELTVRVPETIRIEVKGKLAPYVMGRDVWMHVLNKIGPDGAHGMILEFAGSAIDALPISQRMILCGNAGFAGADGAILPSDDKTVAWFTENSNRAVEKIASDSDAHFEKTFTFAAEEIVPMVTIPPEVYTSKPASEVQGVKVNQCIIGTCVGGTLDDLRAAAAIVAGKKVQEGVRFLVSPVTQHVYVQAAEDGTLATLAEAGARILAPSCDVCLGVQGPLAPGEVSISQQTLNVPGRSGSALADIYLANAATIAASAIAGCITAPAHHEGGNCI